MCYEEADYRAEQQAYAEAEAQAQQECDYAEYLDSLINDGLVNIYALHFAMDLLCTGEFKNSKLTAKEFFSKKLQDTKKVIKGNGEPYDLPF